MYLDLKERAAHTGREEFKVSFLIKEADDLYDVKGQFVQHTIRPDTVTLVWERYLEDGAWTPWQRVGYRPRGAFSCVSGGRVLRDDTVSDNDKTRAFVEVFTLRALGSELTSYAKSLPGLADVIERWESSKLPE